MQKEFYYKLDIALNAVTRKGKELAQTENQVQEWLKDYLIMLTEIEKYALDLKDLWEDPKADKALEKLTQLKEANNFETLKKEIKALRDELSQVYEKYLEEVIANRKRQ